MGNRLLKSLLLYFARFSSEELFARFVQLSLVFFKELKAFLLFLHVYLRHKLFVFSTFFEGNKNTIVKSILIKRGKRNRIFLHISAMVVLTIGVFLSPFITEAEVFSPRQDQLTFTQSSQASPLAPPDVFQTQESDKPRDKILEYKVQKGDTVSLISKRFGIDDDTIRWANDLKNDNIIVGESIKILPVTGVAHKVSSGDTVYTIAKKYTTNPQGIVDFPFNDFANPQTFSLVEGQIVIVPDGIKPEEKPRIVRRSLIATGPVVITGGGFTWPIHGTINQFYAWYHKAVDLGADVGTPIVAAQSGKVSEVYTSGWNGGYGIHVIIAGDNGYSTLYAHMSGVNISPGDSVSAGKTVLGWVGLTGRTTGAHLHFEVRGGGGLYNPLSFLQ